MSNKRKIKSIYLNKVTKEEKPGASLVSSTDLPDVGSVNGYRCAACRKYILIEHKDKGVTPMFLECRATEGCGGRSSSLGYPKEEMPDSLRAKIQWEWYRPTLAEWNMLEPEMQEYVMRGGLVIRKK